jgi:hypothetical protein
MAHTISPGPHPNITTIRIYDELQRDDLTCTDELGLNEGRPLYILVDVSEMDRGLPAGFLDGERQGFFLHPNTAHIALFTNSMMLDTAGRMIAKLTRQKDKLTVHKTREEALAHLTTLVAQAGL